MSKLLKILFLTGSLTACDFKNPFIPPEINDNTDEETFVQDTSYNIIDTTYIPTDTTQVPIDTTFIDTSIIDEPVNRNDFDMYCRIITAALNDTLDYETILQSNSSKVIKLNNRRKRDSEGNVLNEWDQHALIKRIYKDGELYLVDKDSGDFKIDLFENGYILGRLEGNEEYTEISNANILMDIHRTGQHYDLFVQYPLVLSDTEERHKPEESVIREPGFYMAGIEVNYTLRGDSNKYKSMFEIDIGQVGGLEKSINGGNNKMMKMRRKY